MKKAILATKVGMTQIFNDDGVLTPVTVLQAGPCVVTQVKTVEKDGYSAVQVGFVDKREKLVNKPMKGMFDKAGVSYKRYVREFKFENAEEYNVKDEIKAESTFESLGIDSLDAVELVMKLEESLDVQLDLDRDLATIDELVKFVEEKMN